MSDNETEEIRAPPEQKRKASDPPPAAPVYNAPPEQKKSPSSPPPVAVVGGTRSQNSNGPASGRNSQQQQNGRSSGAQSRTEKGGNEEDDDADDSCNACNCACLEKCSNVITNFIEGVFFKLGRFIGTYPWISILIGIGIFLLPLGGLAFFHEETDQAKLWVPANSRAVDDRDLSEEWFPNLLRVSQALIVSDNVLTSNIIPKALDLDQAIKAISFNLGATTYTLETNICYQSGPYCLENSLLAAWNWNEATIDALTDATIKTAVNTNPLINQRTNGEMDAELLLGSITKDGAGDITGALAMTMTYYVKTEDSVDPEDHVLEWEQKFLDVCEQGVTGLEIYRFAQRSTTDIGSGTVSDDLPFLFAGYALVIVFLFSTLGKYSCRDQKVWVGAVGILCVGFAIGVSFSSASLFQFSFGPIHNVLPFLLLGIGVDDMFVVVSAWENLSPEEKLLPLVDRVGYMIKHAGVSILITSLTDFFAFLIGATTIIPALRSFCVFAAMGILGIFLLTLFLFAGVLVYDQRRAESNRNACCCCIKHDEDYKPNECSEESLSEKIFENYVAKALSYLPVKIAVLVATVAFLAAGIAGTAQIEQDFDPNWFIPSGNYLYDYLEKSDDLFPNDGDDAYVYFGSINYLENDDKLLALPDQLKTVDGVADNTVDFYFTVFYEWMATAAATAGTKDANNRPATEADLVLFLDQFLQTTDGAAYQSDVVIDAGKTKVMYSRLYLMFSKMPTSNLRVDAMDGTRSVVDDMGLGKSNAFIYSQAFLTWEGDKAIYLELFRNIGMAFIVVFLVCMLLIANIATVVLVLSCVVFTLIDVIGLIHFWGVTISTVSTINLILAIGLAVDYAAHIGHAFMATTGSRKTRMKTSLTEIGPAVFSGGFSTFLAFVPLCLSSSFVFWTFFQIFFLVCIFGLFHGLIYLPVMLSLLGPSPYQSAHPANSKHHASSDPKADSPLSAQNPTLQAGKEDVTKL